MASFLLNTLSTTAVSAALLAALVWLCRAWIAERLKNAVKHEYDRELEAYRSALSLVYSASGEGQKFAMEARLRAFDRLWKAVLAVRNNTGMITTFLDVLTVEEYKEIKNHPDFLAMVGTLDQKQIVEMTPDRDVEEVRPYVGEIVWALFFGYQALNMRIVFLTWLASTKDEDKIHWYRDSAMRSLLKAALSGEELQQFDQTNIGKIALFRRLIESKILWHWHRLISGAEFGDEALVQTRAISEAIGRIGRP